MNRRRAVALGVGLAVATSVWPPSSGALLAHQVARSDRGVFAQGYVDLPFADGSVRRLEVTLAVPQGPVAGTAPTASVDLRRPWAAVSEWVITDPASGHRRNGTQPCRGVANPNRWDPGALSDDGRTWVGTSVDVTCDDGAGFVFYRMTWEPGPFWLVDNQVATTAMGGLVTSWSADGASGTVALRPLANEQAVVTVCGHRAGGGVDCFGGTTGWGAVVPSLDGMAAEARTA
jgi:hypothetical protein